MDLVVAVGAVKLHSYDEHTTERNLHDCGIAKAVLNNNSLLTKVLSNGSYEAQVILKSLMMSNTRKGYPKFREIIPAAWHERNQVMFLYSAAGGRDNPSVAIITGFSAAHPCHRSDVRLAGFCNESIQYVNPTASTWSHIDCTSQNRGCSSDYPRDRYARTRMGRVWVRSA